MVGHREGWDRHRRSCHWDGTTYDWRWSSEVRALEKVGSPVDSGRIRRPGAGRKRTVDTDPTLKSDLNALVDPVTRGDPESALRWTSKSIRRLARELVSKGHKTSARMVARLLREMGYSLQSNRKTLEGGNHPDRNAQFEHINRKALEAMEAGTPVLSVDTKKKELIGNYKNAGKELQPKGKPVPVRVHDLIDPELGRASPYGVYDIANNEAWVSVGIDHDTSTFAVEALRRWWNKMGSARFPDAEGMLLTADGGGSNGSRVRLWKLCSCPHWMRPGGPVSILVDEGRRWPDHRGPVSCGSG
ncbi:MAG: ISAzo13 family transposase [Verrucomicrobiae bacterium]|nr:ISAzo13 family transposase [Verrucomicrobiae bacterium]